ncbi:hypothetical protein ACKWTF_000142 [Chironomus riparius]
MRVVIILFVICMALTHAEDFGVITNNQIKSKTLLKINDNNFERVSKTWKDFKFSEIIVGIRVTNLDDTESTAKIERGGIDQHEADILITSQVGKNINSIVEFYGPEISEAKASNKAIVQSMPMILYLLLFLGYYLID